MRPAADSTLHAPQLSAGRETLADPTRSVRIADDTIPIDDDAPVVRTQHLLGVLGRDVLGRPFPILAINPQDGAPAAVSAGSVNVILPNHRGVDNPRHRVVNRVLPENLAIRRRDGDRLR